MAGTFTRLAAAAVLALTLVAAGQTCARAAERQPVTILVAAAASLQYSYVEELIPMFQAKYPLITVEGTYDSSGKLQAQIENGLDADVFMSAATRQMDALATSGMIDKDTVVPLLENRVVLITPAGNSSGIDRFERVLEANTIAIGDPDSVPAGQYAREVFQSLGIFDAVLAKASLGTNVTEVLNWVAEGSAAVGVVYATDAATTDRVTVVASAPEGSLKRRVIYPVGILANSSHREEARLFVDFLQSPEAIAVFVKYGFAAAN
ncbi:MAG: molybdate ABC transporter substrate-binding protein [Planctomycetes bacterium]|nr:molybdate ABC transporter substrate-binding protein [Planctomycetota bacterium]